MSEQEDPGEPRELSTLNIQNLSDHSVTVTLQEFLQASLDRIKAVNLEFQNRRLSEEIEILRTENQELTERLAAAERRAERAEANIVALRRDPLTGLDRREHILDALDQAHQEIVNDRRKPSGATNNVSVIMGDIDHFKMINDTHGHSGGDDVLQQVGETLRTTIREADRIGRYGGEEFLVVINGDLETAAIVAEKLRAKIMGSTFSTTPRGGERIDIPVTMSFGVASFDPELDETPVHLYSRADRALYSAKEEGRNLVCVNDKGLCLVYEKSGEGTHFRPLPMQPIKGMPTQSPKSFEQN